jgi:formylglycine-generating enzyme required for sulfatase activity
VLGAFALLAVVVAGGFAVRWRDGLREIALRDRDIGDSVLVLRAFDWDPVTFTATDTTAADLTWELRRPLPEDNDLPGPPLPPDDLSSHSLQPPAGAVRADAFAARGGSAVLMVERRDRAGRACSPVAIPIRRLPGHGQRRTLSVRIPTCEATLAGMIAVPAGPFIAGGIGEPPSPDQQRYHMEERVVSLPSYWLDRTEVPNGLMMVLLTALQLSERTSPIYPSSDEYAHAGEAGYPVTSLTWSDAAAVCRLLGKRLPTSPEWQKALRGGQVIGDPPEANPHPRRNLPWGVTMDGKRSNINYGDHVAPAAVGSFRDDVGPYGHLDLAGNVTEWTSDRWADGFVVLHGGNWADTSPDKLVDFNAIENPRQPKASMYTFGFRCAADVAITPHERIESQQ